LGFIVTLVLIACSGAACSYLAWRVEHISRSRWFQWGGLALWVLLLILMQSQIEVRSAAEGVFTLVAIPVACIFWAPFVAFVVVHTLSRMVRALLSLDHIRVRPGYSEAEAAAARGDLERAMALYRRGAQAHPEDPEPHRRIADLYLRLGRPDDAIRAFRQAQDREPDPNDQLLIVFAIAEILADGKDDPAAALRVLEEFLDQYPQVRGRAFAEERIRALRSRLGAPERKT